MATGAKINIEGLAALGQAMQALAQDVQRKTARSATAAAATVVRKAAVANVVALGLVDTGNLRAAVGVQRTRKTSLTSAHRVYVRGGSKAAKKAAAAGALGKDAFYWKFLELGTVKRGPTPFLRPALENNQQPAVDAMAKRLKARIEKAGKK